MKNIVLLISILMFTFCKPSVKPGKEELMEVDRSFSATSVEKGYNKAFIEFAHANAILLRANSVPVEGIDAVTRLFEKADTTGVRFTWEPIDADIALSGELGFTYGVYSFKKDTTTEKGTYVSVWKKDATGNWKYVLDCGNKGTGE